MEAKARMEKAVFVTMAIVLLASTLALASTIQFTSASGAIRIRSDGVVDPPTAHIVTADNVTYAFTDNIDDSIVVERSNIVITGNGYTVQGGNGEGGSNQWGAKLGLHMISVNNVTIKNTNIESFDFGICIETSSNCSIVRNNITGNNPIGVVVADSSNCSILGNYITGNNQQGIYFGIPRMSRVFLGSSNFNTVSRNNIADNYWGIYFGASSNFNTVSDNNITDNHWGVELFDSFSNNILGNNIVGNYRGIEFSDSFGNTVSGNDIAKNMQYGMRLHDISAYNIVSDNNITDNLHGISLQRSTRNSIFGNNITANSDDGICLYDSSDYNSISGNDITNNKKGIRLDHSSNCRIFGNNVANLNHDLWMSSSMKNILYHNNLMGNTDQTCILDSMNVWDNGYPSGGNYWNCCSVPDKDMDKIGDESRVIDKNNADRYPLTYPFGFVPKPDVNGDGVVNDDDITVVAGAFLSEPGDLRWNPLADMDMNETINIVDVAKVAKQHGYTI
jgi:parallel beta-helix repeat protein